MSCLPSTKTGNDDLNKGGCHEIYQTMVFHQCHKRPSSGGGRAAHVCTVSQKKNKKNPAYLHYFFSKISYLSLSECDARTTHLALIIRAPPNVCKAAQVLPYIIMEQLSGPPPPCFFSNTFLFVSMKSSFMWKG